MSADLGGAEEDRTPDLRIANATLSQLSYRPTLCAQIGDCRPREPHMVAGESARAKRSVLFPAMVRLEEFVHPERACGAGAEGHSRRFDSVRFAHEAGP